MSLASCSLTAHWDLFTLLSKKTLPVPCTVSLLQYCFFSPKKDSISGGACETWINPNVGSTKEKGWKPSDRPSVAIEVAVFSVVWGGVAAKDEAAKCSVHATSGVCRHEDIVLLTGTGDGVEFEIKGTTGWFVTEVFNCCPGKVTGFCKIDCVSCTFCGTNLLFCTNVII